MKLSNTNSAQLSLPLLRGGSAGRTSEQSQSQASSREVPKLESSVDSNALVQRAAEIQETRAQQFDASQSTSLKNRQALASYQQTEQAAQEFEQGVLVGIDLFA